MEFTSDWFSHNIPVWSQYVVPLAVQPLQILEIGSHEGRSAVWMLENIVTDPESRLSCVDLWESREVRRRFRANISETGRSSQVTEYLGESLTCLKTIEESFDLIYIDGSHEARDVLTDAALCWSVLKPGGLLIFDDYQWSGPVEFRPRDAIDVFLQLWSMEIEVIHKAYQVIVRRQNSIKNHVAESLNPDHR
ncbi:MAG: class I SAM-dependent methyltransferase [Planctomycetaceae bacterium]